MNNEYIPRYGEHQISDGVYTYGFNRIDHDHFVVTDKQLRCWAEELVAVADDGEAEEWIAAFAEFHPPEIVEQVRNIARKLWSVRKENAEREAFWKTRSAA
ncbi:MAG: hypothetical protein LBE32_05470 [Burkholderiales bacterium]|jgi:hypothetical protein|nr:hypothetical protein [Burkholderiales bacterium]